MMDSDDNTDARAAHSDSSECSVATPPGAFSPSKFDLSVLVVDDHPAQRRCAEAIFEALGCAVTLAESGAVALQACARTRFDLVLMDRHMPGGHGDEAVRRLRWREGSTQHTFIACCSSDPPRDLSTGYDVLAPKPLTVAAAADLLRWVAARSVSPPSGAAFRS